MWINHTVTVLSALLGVVFVPISLITMNLGGVLIGCTGQFVILLIPAIIAFGLSFVWPGIRDISLIGLGLALFGLLILPVLSLIWLPFYAVTLGLSHLYRAAPWLSVPIGIVGIPVAVVGNEYIGLVPSMGEFEQKWVKMSICDSFPFSADFSEYYIFVKQYCPEGVIFSFYYVDLDTEWARGGITKDQYKRWSRIRNLTAFRKNPGPIRADLV